MKEYNVQLKVSTTQHTGEGPYADWCSESQIELKGVGGKKSDYTTISSVDFKRDDVCFLVMIATGDGDSFGSSINSEIEPIHLFRSKELAEILYYKIQLVCYNKHYYESLLDYKVDNNTQLQLATSHWNGYFNSVDTLIVAQCTMGKIGKRSVKILHDYTAQKLSEEQLKNTITVLEEKNSIDQKVSQSIKTSLFKL